MPLDGEWIAVQEASSGELLFVASLDLTCSVEILLRDEFTVTAIARTLDLIEPLRQFFVVAVLRIVVRSPVNELLDWAPEACLLVAHRIAKRQRRDDVVVLRHVQHVADG